MSDGDTKGTNEALAATITVAGGAPLPASPAAMARYRHYRLGAVLGRGGMGEVVSADDDRIGRSVAIKRMRAAGNPAAVERFTREARIQGQLEHPAIVPVHELGEDESGAPIIVMKQVRGTTLAEVLRTGKFTRPRLLRAFVDVCLAVEFAHSRGVVHRDLKPANIALGDFGEVYVLDWGIARVLGDSQPAATPLDGVDPGATQAGAVLGTPGYMSPEQLAGDPGLDGRADVYSLGCVLFEILAGDKLGARAGTQDAMPSRSALDGNVPPELDTACVRATASDREQRYASARELAGVVERVLDGDRDLVQRRQLASQLFEEAKAAVAKGSGDAERRTAIRAAGRALALDSDSAEIAEFVGRLMLEPPTTLPAEVEQQLERQEVDNIEAGVPIATLNGLLALVLVPCAIWAGVRDVPLLAGSAVAGILFVWLRALIVRHGVYRPAAVVGVNITAGLCLLGLGLVASPLLALPFAVVLIARAASYPGMTPSWTMPLAAIAACVVPPLLGAFGILPSSITIAGGDLILHTAATSLDATGTVVYLLVSALLALGAPVNTFNATIERERAARRATLLQAWQLRQLVPATD